MILKFRYKNTADKKKLEPDKIRIRNYTVLYLNLLLEYKKSYKISFANTLLVFDFFDISIWALKGQSHEIFDPWFFRQTTPLGP
jgi:hypothetical protein